MSRGMEIIAAVLRIGSIDSTMIVSVRKGPFSPLRWSMPSSSTVIRAGSVQAVLDAAFAACVATSVAALVALCGAAVAGAVVNVGWNNGFAVGTSALLNC